MGVLFGVTFVVATMPLAALAAWTETQVDTEAGTQERPVIAVGVYSTSIFLAWASNAAGNFDVKLRGSHDSGTTWCPTPEVTVASGGFHQHFPSIAATRTALHVAYRDSLDDIGGDIWYVRVVEGPSCTFTSDPPVNIAGSLTRDELQVRIAADRAGNTYFVWKDCPDATCTPTNVAGGLIQFRVRLADGTLEPAILLSEMAQEGRVPDIVVRGATRATAEVFVVWTQRDATDGDDLAWRRSTDGGLSWFPPLASPPALLDDPVSGVEYFDPAADLFNSASQTGVYVAFTNVPSADATTWRIFLYKGTPDGVGGLTWATKVQVSDDTTPTRHEMPDVRAPSGSPFALVGFASGEFVDSAQDAYAALTSNYGATFKPDERVNATTAGNQHVPKVEIGSSLMVWQGPAGISFGRDPLGPTVIRVADLAATWDDGGAVNLSWRLDDPTVLSMTVEHVSGDHAWTPAAALLPAPDQLRYSWRDAAPRNKREYRIAVRTALGTLEVYGPVSPGSAPLGHASGCAAGDHGSARAGTAVALAVAIAGFLATAWRRPRHGDAPLHSRPTDSRSSA